MTVLVVLMVVVTVVTVAGEERDAEGSKAGPSFSMVSVAVKERPSLVFHHPPAGVLEVEFSCEIQDADSLMDFPHSSLAVDSQTEHTCC